MTFKYVPLILQQTKQKLKENFHLRSDIYFEYMYMMNDWMELMFY